MSEIKNTYRNRIYNSYNSAREEKLAPITLEGLRPRSSYLRRMIKNFFPKNKEAKIFDLGCGHGAIIYYAKEVGYKNIQGIDGSLEQINAAKSLGIDNLIHGDLIEKLNLSESQTIDCIVTFDVIEHFDRNELINLVDEVNRVLKKGGKWIIHVPNAESPFGSRMRYWDLTHEIAFTRTSIAQLLYSSGFSNVESFEDEPAIHGLKSMVRWVLWRCIRAILRIYLTIETGDTMKKGVFTQNMLVVAEK